ncbi:MAG: thioredoxin [Clostridia bacterium]|nr:thioredoxin [Clostridia bacterium]
MKAREMDSVRLEELLKSDKPVLVDFWAPWCTYCRRISDAYDRIAEQYGDRLHVVKVNIDDNEALTVRESIEVIPTLVLYQSGRALGSIVAPESRTMIETFIGETMHEAARRADEPDTAW